jgi:hypothetical protein
VHCDKGVSGVQGAGGRGAATGEPPQMGTSGSQRRGFRRTRAGAGGVPAVGGRGGGLVPQVGRSGALYSKNSDPAEGVWMALFTPALGLYGGVLRSGELQGPVATRDSLYMK